MAKKKKQPKIEKVFEGSSKEEQLSVDENKISDKSAVDEFLGLSPNDIIEEPDDGLTDYQRGQKEKLETVKSKISQILKSQNIEIVDENFGDEYDTSGGEKTAEKSQQDYDSLKEIFGDKKRKQELTLTIDDFDYTYVGQYIDDYDLIHMKNIKRIKLKRKYPKWMKKALIASSLVVVIGVGVFLGVFLTRQVPVTLKSVSLNQTQNNYYVSEVFDYTGLYLIAEYTDGSTKKIKLNKSYLNLGGVLGRVEHVGSDGRDIQFLNGTIAYLPFTYTEGEKSFSVTYTVNIHKKVEDGLECVYTNGLFNLQAGDYITDAVLKTFVDYGNYGKTQIKLSNSNLEIYVNDEERKLTYEQGAGFKLISDLTQSSKILVVYNYDSSSKIELEITYQEGVYNSSIKIEK